MRFSVDLEQWAYIQTMSDGDRKHLKLASVVRRSQMVVLNIASSYGLRRSHKVPVTLERLQINCRLEVTEKPQ